MFNKFICFFSNSRLDEFIKLLLSVAFLLITGPVKFDIPGEIPITLQSLSVLLVAIWFGWRTGLIAVGIYIFCGAIGLPVFAGFNSGVEKLVGSSGGFFIGFLLSGLVAGIFADKKYFQNPFGNLILWLIGHLIILLTGGFWFSFYDDEWLTMIKMILPGAAIKIITGWLLTQLLFQIVRVKKVS